MRPTVTDASRLHLVPLEVPREVPREKPPAGRKPARTRHPGVLLLKPDGWPSPPPAGGKNPSWRARHVDPDTGKRRVVTLTPEQARTELTRRAFAVALSAKVRARRDEIRGGSARHAAADLTLADAFARYFDEDFGRLRSVRTRDAYRKTAEQFVEWARVRGHTRSRDLTKALLADWSTSRSKAERLVAKPGGARGAKTARGMRSAATPNKELRQLRAVLRKMRKHDVIRIGRDEISEALEQEKHEYEQKPILRVRQIAQLIDACVKHDAAVFERTRDGRKDTPRHKPILPVILFFLLTGMRPEEAVPPNLINMRTGKPAEGVAWSDVDLDEGKIHIRAAVAKHGHKRDISLGHSPLLASLLRSERSSGRILGGYTEDEIGAAIKRLVADYGSPVFTLRTLRRTCGTFLTCAPGIFGAAAAYMSARQLGHSTAVAEKHYTGVVKIPHDARTTEAAMQISVERCLAL